MNSIHKLITILLSIPNTLRFNFHYFPIKDAMSLPVLVSNKVTLEKMGPRGSFECPNKFGTVRMGFSNGSFNMGRGKKSNFHQSQDSRITIKGKACFCNPFYMTTKNDSVIEIGSNFKGNTNLVISCAKNITIGDNVLCAWNTTIIDGDGHFIYQSDVNRPSNLPRRIVIGNQVWLSSNSTLLKGSIIPDNCIISANAVVSNGFDISNCIIGGIPAKILKENISWDETWID